MGPVNLRANGSATRAPLPMEQIVQAVADGILMVDKAGQVLFANPAAEAMFDRGALVGTEFGFPIGSARRTEIEVVRRSGGVLTAEMKVTELRHGHPAMTSYLVSLRDMTDRKRTEAEIRRLNESLAERVKELEAYTHSVSHDLQGPLRSICSYVGLAIQEAATGSAEVQRYLARIEVNADRMSNLIRDLLRLSHSSLAALQLTQVNLRELVRSIAVKMKEDDASGATFVIGDLPTVEADVSLLTQVFENLFGNAIKYRRTEELPRITVECHEDDGMHVIAVHDNGEGFAPEFAEKIFGLFERLHDAEIAGTGIGLSIVQRAVERHGGRVWAVGSPQGGATFFFTLPVSR